MTRLQKYYKFLRQNKYHIYLKIINLIEIDFIVAQIFSNVPLMNSTHKYVLLNLRLWIRPRTPADEEIQVLYFVNIIPKKLQKTTEIAYETLDEAKKRFYKKLETNPLEGLRSLIVSSFMTVEERFTNLRDEIGCPYFKETSFERQRFFFFLPCKNLLNNYCMQWYRSV